MGRRGKQLSNRIRGIRTEARLSQDELASRAGLTRQSVNAIENGQYVPNTVVAMRLARALQVRVEDLFALDAAEEDVDAAPLESGGTQRVVAGVIDGEIAAHGLRGIRSVADGFVPADGLYDETTGRTTLLTPRDVLERTALLVGCDPSLGLLAARVTAMSPHQRLVWIPGSSSVALDALRTQRAHVAGVHLRDRRTGAFNGRATLTGLGGDAVIVSYAQWEQGFVVHEGNPAGVRTVSDLANPAVRFVNREPGSGSRLLLDQALAAEMIEATTIRGYETFRASHMDVARHVASGAADVGVAIEAVATSGRARLRAAGGGSLRSRDTKAAPEAPGRRAHARGAATSVNAARAAGSAGIRRRGARERRST